MLNLFWKTLLVRLVANELIFGKGYWSVFVILSGHGNFQKRWSGCITLEFGNFLNSVCVALGFSEEICLLLAKPGALFISILLVQL